MVTYGNKCFVRFEALVEEDKHTGEEIIATLIKEFPKSSRTAIKVLVSDSSWSDYRYSGISRLIVLDHKTKVLSFCG